VLHHVLAKRLLFRAQSLSLSIIWLPKSGHIALVNQQNEEKVADFSVTDHIFLGFLLESGTLFAVFEPCSATVLAASLNEK